MINRISNLALCLTLLVAVSPAYADEDENLERAQAITQRALIADTHIDMPYRLHDGWADVARAQPDRNFDYPRAQEGGLNLPFMSIYCPAEMEASGGGYELANNLIDNVEALVGRAPGKFAMAHSTQDAVKAKAQGMIALALGMENGTPIEGDLDKLRHFHDRGIRYVTLAHSLSNHISDSSYDENRQWNGLSPFGKEVVAEMNRLGIMIDVSHISDEAFFQVMELSKAPVLATHSSARHFTPGWERNMSDEMIEALAARGGIIMINFGSSFLTEDARQWYEVMGKAREAWVEETGSDTDGPEIGEWMKAYLAENPFPFATLSDAVDHFDHVIKLVGVEYVGIGSDYDGVGESLPIGLKDVSTYPNLVAEFLRRGYSESDIEAILGGNLMRVWRAVEAYAAEQAR